MSARPSCPSPTVLALALVVSGAPACAAVQPWERALLASPAMESPFAETSLMGEYRDKAVQVSTAGGLPGAAPGGGCGCTQ
ncbi:DUF4266 domain-containing protein [Myxococcota bacterium]|nr:DUF4266 domain-containing protein [Myxococcota bacterium]